MYKFLSLLGMFAFLVGCQTTETSTAQQREKGFVERSEKLLLRVDQIVGTYDVKVQRAICDGANPMRRDQWIIIGSSEVEGYPGTFRISEGGVPLEHSVKETFLLDGMPVDISQEPGVHLIAKVLPVHQNTARVVGVFVQVKPSGEHVETFSMPFDIKCDMGKVYEVYSRKMPVGADQKEIAELYMHLD